MFTKEHFEKVASVLSAARVAHITMVSGAVNETVDKLAEAFADMFAQSNERFSRKAFIGACNAASRSKIRRLVAANNDKKLRPHFHVAHDLLRDTDHTCSACGRPELTCSQSPCDAVVADRLA